MLPARLWDLATPAVSVFLCEFWLDQTPNPKGHTVLGERQEAPGGQSGVQVYASVCARMNVRMSPSACARTNVRMLPHIRVTFIWSRE